MPVIMRYFLIWLVLKYMNLESTMRHGNYANYMFVMFKWFVNNPLFSKMVMIKSR